MAFWTKKSHQNFICMKNFLRFEILQKDFIITEKYFSACSYILKVAIISIVKRSKNSKVCPEACTLSWKAPSHSDLVDLSLEHAAPWSKLPRLDRWLWHQNDQLRSWVKKNDSSYKQREDIPFGNKGHLWPGLGQRKSHFYISCCHVLWILREIIPLFYCTGHR